jgi:surface antigen
MCQIVRASLVALACLAVAMGPSRLEAQSPATAAPGSGLLDQIPDFAALQVLLEPADELAVLEAIHVGLSDAADGSTYLWQRRNSLIGGSVQPTASFRDPDGRVCRHFVVQVQLGPHLRRAEGLACRQPDKSWVLSG